MSNSNPFLDFWNKSHQEFSESPFNWMSPQKNMDKSSELAEYFDKSMQSWRQCEDQYKTWVKVSESWFPNAKNNMPDSESDIHSLTKLLSPMNFYKTNLEKMNQFFMKLSNSPDFADIGMFEKSAAHTSKDWIALLEANDEYQNILAQAWSKAFTLYSQQCLKQSPTNPLNSKALLELWLEIADKELTSTLRSDDFLTAQRSLFGAATTYKLKHNELIEQWCEAHNIPTRSEIDDLHKTVYELKREIRSLKKNKPNSTANKKNQPTKKAQQDTKSIKKSATIKTAPKKKVGSVSKTTITGN